MKGKLRRNGAVKMEHGRNRNAAKKPDERRRKEYVSFFGQRWSIEVGEQIQAYLEQHGQPQKQFLDDVVKEKILTSNG